MSTIKDLKREVAAFIIAQRKAFGISKTEMAARANMHRINLGFIEHGTLDRFTLDRLISVVNTLGFEVEIVIRMPTPRQSQRSPPRQRNPQH